MLFDGQMITIKRGQFLTSIRKLAERWKWDRKKVTKFLNILENEKMVTTDRTTRRTTITIVNWDKFQVSGATLGTTDGATPTPTMGPLFPTNNNDKECIKNENKERGGSPTLPTLEEVRAYCLERDSFIDPETFFDYYSSRNWIVGGVLMTDWKAQVRVWEKRDTRDSASRSKDKSKLRALEDYYLNEED